MMLQFSFSINRSSIFEGLYHLFRPSKATRPARIRAETTIAPTAPPAAVTGRPGEGVGVGGRSVAVEVGVDVGQGVLVGGTVGVDVGWVGVGVNAAWMVSFSFTKIVDFIVRPFKVRISASGTL
jgi:hypothetical protein